MNQRLKKWMRRRKRRTVDPVDPVQIEFFFSRIFDAWVVVQSAKPVGSECGLTESVAGRE